VVTAYRDETLDKVHYSALFDSTLALLNTLHDEFTASEEYRSVARCVRF